MKLNVKTVMRIKDLRDIKAVQVADFGLDGKLSEPGKPGVKVTADLCEPGFYFMGNVLTGNIHARFYVGRQRSKSGFANVASQLRLRRSKVGENIMNWQVKFAVYFVPLSLIKKLTNGYRKGKLALLVTRTHNDAFQNLEEMNRMLSDNFKFYSQKY